MKVLYHELIDCMGKSTSKFCIEMDRSVSEYFYDPDGAKGHKCGYCGSQDSSVSNGMWTHYLTCEDYQDMIDRGWRRCGKYCYKPVMNVTCCPQYAIRCEATKFRLSKSQKKVLKTMTEYISHGKGEPSQARMLTSSSTSGGTSVGGSSMAESKGVERTSRKEKLVRPGVGADPTKPPCRKAKEIRRELKLKRQLEKTTDTDCKGASDRECGAADVGTNSPTAASKHMSSKQSRTAQDVHEIFSVGPDGKKPLEAFLSLPAGDAKQAHKLELKLVRTHPPSPEFKSTFKESYELYKKYQMVIHNDPPEDCTEKQYSRFLCDSPLIPKKGARGWPCDYGSYHQQYRIDGKLVAVGVLDVLPNCLSSVYTYYDPDFNFLSLGVYTALRELELTRKMYLCDSERFLYYCMGYYVHACQKMRYKGQYYPSFLLCPESYKFIPIETCRPKLDAGRYARLNDEATPSEVVATWLDSCLVLFEQTIMPYAIYKSIAGMREDAKVTEYACFVGPSVANRMVVIL